MKLTKLTEAEFNARNEEETCTEKRQKPTVKVYRGDLPVKLTFKDYDLPIEPGTYNWLVFIPCELVGEHNWIRGFSSNYVVGLTLTAGEYKIAPDGPRFARSVKPGNYNIIELHNNGVLFAFN